MGICGWNWNQILGEWAGRGKPVEGPDYDVSRQYIPAAAQKGDVCHAQAPSTIT